MSCSENQPPNRSDDERNCEQKRLRVQREAYVRLARRKLLEMLIRRGTASIDDVRDLIALPDGIDPKIFGATPKANGFRDIIEPISYVRSRRRVAHGRPILLWRLKNVAAAQEWLRNHVALPIEGPNENGEPAE